MQRGLYCETFVLFLSISLIFDLNSIPSGIKKMHAIFFFPLNKGLFFLKGGLSSSFIVLCHSREKCF